MLELHVHRYTLAFVFVPLLQKDLKEFVEDWNTHPIRCNKQSDSPSGRPEDMYSLPVIYGNI